MGRPARSVVRDRLAEMLFIAGKLTAYDAHKHYQQLFSSATQRNIYYQLRRGVDLGLFNIADVVQEEGEYSWGPTTRKVYFELAKAASVQFNKQIKEYFDEARP
ncbi:MAG: hypothetical protein KC535_01460 [Nanoarchaeota archaeon]|nr:hypothetical protein [Nanoarchaeota archaeon]